MTPGADSYSEFPGREPLPHALHRAFAQFFFKRAQFFISSENHHGVTQLDDIIGIGTNDDFLGIIRLLGTSQDQHGNTVGLTDFRFSQSLADHLQGRLNFQDADALRNFNIVQCLDLRPCAR